MRGIYINISVQFQTDYDEMMTLQWFRKIEIIKCHISLPFKIDKWIIHKWRSKYRKQISGINSSFPQIVDYCGIEYRRNQYFHRTLLTFVILFNFILLEEINSYSISLFVEFCKKIIILVLSAIILCCGARSFIWYA